MKSSAWRLLGILVVLLGLTGVASAGRKRVVVLELEGPNAEKFQSDLVKLIKKSHTVVSAEKWADKGGDASPSKDNLKKTAKKLKADGVVTGVVEKRRGQYILRVKLHAGANGKVIGQPVFKADKAKIDSSLAGDVKTELVGLIDELEANRGGGGDDEEEEEEKPKKGKKDKVVEEEEEEEKPKKSGFAKKGKVDDEEEEEEKPKKGKKDKVVDEEEAKPKKGKKTDDEEEENPLGDGGDGDEKEETEVASKDDDDEKGDVEEKSDDDDDDSGVKMSDAVALSPGNRAVDLAVGFSFSARRMGFVYQSDIANTSRPPRYRGTPVPGLLIDATIYPLAFGHKSDAMTKNIGLTVLFDKVLLVNSQAPDGTKLNSSQQRYAVGATFRYPFNKTATSPVVGAMLRYGRQKFTIDGNAGIPNVNYTIIDPMVFFKYPVSEKLALGVNLGYMLFTNAGAIQNMDQYGSASVSGFEGEIGGDYGITKNIFMRASFKFATIGFAFKEVTMKTNVDSDPEIDVSGARDTYLGGMISAGYLY